MILFDSAKIGVAAWSAGWLEPYVSNVMPTIGDSAQFLIAALITATVLEFLLQLLFGWPCVEIVWQDKEDAIPLSEVQAKVRKSTSSTQVFHFKISTRGSGWLGYVALRWCMSANVKLRIGVDRASIYPTVEDSYKDGIIPTVSGVDAYRGFEIDLGEAPNKPGPWHWADVRWRDDSTPRGDQHNINYDFVHKNKLVECLLNIVIYKKSLAKHFMIVGS